MEIFIKICSSILVNIELGANLWLHNIEDKILLEQQVVVISNSIFKSRDNIIHTTYNTLLQYVSSTFCFILNTALKMLALSKNSAKKHTIYTRLSTNIKYNILNYSGY